MQEYLMFTELSEETWPLPDQPSSLTYISFANCNPNTV